MAKEQDMEATKPHYGPYAAPPAGNAPAHATSQPVDLARPYGGETYYRVPPIKQGPYGWAIIFYFFIGGIAARANSSPRSPICSGAGGMRRSPRRAGTWRWRARWSARCC